MSRSKITTEELVLFIAQGLTVPEIAEKNKMNESSVRLRIKKLGLTPVNAHKKKQPYKDEDMIRLSRQGLSQAEIGRALGLTQQAVLYGVNRLNLTCSSGRSKQRNFTDDELKRLIDQCLTKDKIAYELDVNESSVRSHANRLNLNLITKTQEKEKAQQRLLQQFIDEELSPYNASKQYNIAVSTICYWEEKYHITLKDGREGIGEKITQGKLHTEERAIGLLKKRTEDRFRLAEGEKYVNSHQSYRFYCVEHEEVHSAAWTQIAYGGQGLKCCGEANRLLQGWDNIPANFADPGGETWVFLYETSVKGYCKIGVSDDVERRASNGGKRVYAKQFDKLLCHTRLHARIIEEAVLWEFKKNAVTPVELLEEVGWSEIIQSDSQKIWKVTIELFDRYLDLNIDEFCEQYMHLNPLTMSQIEELCGEKGIDWKSQK